MNKIIAFEWQHRCWKWLQIEKISEFLRQQEYNVLINRGAFYRKGEWKKNSLEDPYSKRRQNNWNKEWIRDIKHSKLQIELSKLMFTINSIYNNSKVISILDRSIYSFAVWKYIEYKKWNISFDNFLKIVNSMMLIDNNTDSSKVKVIQPDIILFLKCDKENIIKRIQPSDLVEKHKKDLILNFTESYEETIKFMPESLKQNIVTINWNLTPDEVSKQIINSLQSKLWIR